MSEPITIMERLARREREARRKEAKDDPQPSWIDEVLEKLKHPTYAPCYECGETTRDNFFGVPLCSPYDSTGRVVKQCKWKYRDRTGG
jgi:hypothetical protein